MDKKPRRCFLQACGVTGFGFLAGCITRERSGESTTSSPTTSSSSSLSPENLLPQEGGGWTQNQVESGAFSWSAHGATDGIFGYYTSPENRTYEVVIMEMKTGYSPERKANNWKCHVEWNVTLSYRRFAIAASTGTAQRTFTPEQPPHMTRTPIPETTEPAKDLLSNSPELSREYIDRHAITEADC